MTPTNIPQKPNDRVLEKCRPCGGLVIFRPRYQHLAPQVFCDGCGRDYTFLKRERADLAAWLDADTRRQIAAACEGDRIEDAALMTTMTAGDCQRTALAFGQLIINELHGDASAVDMGEELTPHDYYRMARRAFRFAERAPFCETCGDPLFTRDEEVTGFCHPCLWGTRLGYAQIADLCTAMTGGAQ